MKILENFIAEFHAKDQVEKTFQKGLEGEVKYVSSKLLDEEFLPSVQLKEVLNKQLRRCQYPIEIAIVGQFSSGKSTFLNALLSKDILPMGITPVTSKVTYINYAEEYRLKITYKSGAQKDLPIDEIAKFSDQREALVESIKYLTIYAPIELLKQISFVDTPGLNSQSRSDTQETLKALNDVGGIIWLSLIDNAGKLSEEEMLEKYMQNFSEKSLCILNQKDKFTQVQIDETRHYIEDKFSKYFSKVIPISAKKALEARAQQKNVLMEQEENDFIQNITQAIREKKYTQEIYLKNYESYTTRLQTIQENDDSLILKIQEESNINAVLEFIEHVIEPKAKESKTFAIRKDLQGICDILIQEYEVLIKVYNTLSRRLQSIEATLLAQLDTIEEIASSDLLGLYDNIDVLIETIAAAISQKIYESKETFFEEKNSFLSKENYVKKELASYTIDRENIHKTLFYDEQQVEHMLKRVTKKLEQIYKNIYTAYDDIFMTIDTNVQAWQRPYELIKKNREIASDLEFSSMRHFASKSYENILRHYYALLYENRDVLHQKIAYFQGSIEKNAFFIVDSVIHTFEDKIRESIEFCIQDRTSFSVYHPTQDEILKSLRDGFKCEEIESMFVSNRNYVKKMVKNTQDEYKKVNLQRITFIKEKQTLLDKKVKKIQEIKNTIHLFEV